jgi:hypothetical protein
MNPNSPFYESVGAGTASSSEPDYRDPTWHDHEPVEPKAFTGYIASQYQCVPTRPLHAYLVTAVLQLCVEEESSIDAAITVKDLLNGLIETSQYRNDPLNGAIVEAVVDIDV